MTEEALTRRDPTRCRRDIRLWAAVVAVAAIAVPATAQAYIGPGAGVAVATTAFALIVSLVLAVFGLLFWPVRMAYRLVTRKRVPHPARVRRAVIVGLDGLDPDVTRRLMDAGKLPNLSRIAEKGGFSKLGTTYPAMSPVAWSSFATGVNPAKHGIFDFLTRNPKSYLPDLSSADVKPPRRSLAVGDYRIPLGKPQLKLLRKSKPFWEILGRYRIPCSVLRVPITFPPDKFAGTMLSAMCVPDLQGSQGSFTYYSSAPQAEETIGGRCVQVAVDGDHVAAHLEGPPNPIRKRAAPLELPMWFELDRAGGRATLRVGKKSARPITLEINKYSDWVPVSFPMGLGMKMRGMCRFRLLSIEPEFRLYVTPINIDPSRPIMPISHPFIFSVFLAKLLGRFATLGLAEDTWALNERVLDEEAFLEQAWANHDEREAMFFEMLKRTRRGLIACVFDGTDRIQHMFMRYMDDGHPALSDDERRSPYKHVIEDTYKRMDEMIGHALEEVDIDDPTTLFMVLSDHGFKTFRRGINLNSWLHQNGYLVLEEGRNESGEWFKGVDWSRTRAFALGLGGIFLNIRGRESQGVVAPDEAEPLAEQIAGELTGLMDPEVGAVGIRRAYPSHQVFKGPYRDNAPELVVGYAAGWRASWDGVRGIVNDVIFDDNTKAWSGDHCIDPELVPGVLIANRNLSQSDTEQPIISDVAPTLLDLFGIPTPRYMDGRSLTAA